MIDCFDDTHIVCCRGLVVQYGDLTAVDSLDLDVRRGECFGLLGPNGAGKTTSVEVFEGLRTPSSGHVSLFGKSWSSGADHWIRERMGVALQETRLSEMLSVRETVHLFASFYRDHLTPDEVISLLGLTEKSGARVGKLSGGQRQRLSLACALVGAPDILFLDEPTTGLDPQARMRIWEVVEDFTSSGGTVLLTTHYMEEATRLCDRVAIIDRGKLIALDTPSRLVEMLGSDQIVEIELADADDPAALESVEGVRRIERRGAQHALIVSEIKVSLPSILEVAAREGWSLDSLTTHRATLDDVFVHLTGRGLRDG